MNIKSAIWFLILATVVSCGKENPAGKAESVEQGRLVRLQAALGEETKASVTETGAVSWEENDEISVWTSAGVKRTFSMVSISEGQAYFQAYLDVGESPKTLAVYPVRSFASLSGNTARIVYPYTYTYREGQMDAPMAAIMDGETISFRHLGGVVRIQCDNVPAYKVQADSILNHYVGMHPDSLLTLSFKSKSVRRTMLGNFPEFYITIKPLKGTVEQFNFEYYFTPKIDGNREIDDIPYSLIRRGYQKSPISKMSTISYTGELWTDTLEDVTTEELVRDYNFIYKITNVRYQGKNWGDLPYNVKKYVEGKSDYDKEWAIESIISQDIDSSYKSLFEYYYDITSDIRREKFPTISTLFFMYENQ
jgi:hypothetical protein